VDRVSRSTSFAGTKLLDGSFALSATNRTLAIDSTSSGDLGATAIDGTTYNLADLKSGGRLDTTDSANVEGAGEVLDAAISQVSTQRGRVGAFQKHTIQSRKHILDVAYENLKSAESQIRDLDYAAEVSRTVRYELLHRSSLGALKLINHSMRRGRLDLRA
jgi:flagellin-like hook-associated protein FlgL